MPQCDCKRCGLGAALAYFGSDFRGQKKGLAERQTQIIALSESITARAMQLIDRYALSHGLRLADALIGATALEHKI